LLSLFSFEETAIAVQHKDIVDAQRHEPKGASTATTNSVYASNGSGSGAWTKIKSPNLDGISSDGGSSNKKIITNGAEGFVQRLDAAYGSMVITNNTNGFAVTAAADSTLNTNTDYVLFTGTGAPWASENLFGGFTFSTNQLVLPVTGVYEVQAWSNITSYPTNTAFVAIKYRLNGTTFGPRKVKSKSNSAGDAGVLSGFGLFSATAGDFIQLMIASSATGSLIIGDLNTSIKLVRQSA